MVPREENLSLMACIINEKRAAGRKGLGAVMGAKNLKAVAVRGSQDVKIAKPDEFKSAVSSMLKEMKESPVLYPAFSKLGTPMVVEATSAIGIFPTKNYEDTGKWVPKALYNEDNNERRLSNEHCYRCPVGCSQIKLAKHNFKGAVSAPEFETFYSFGGSPCVDDVDAVVAADRYCDEVGIDTISAGATIAFAMELFEKGILTEKDTDGMKNRVRGCKCANGAPENDDISRWHWRYSGRRNAHSGAEDRQRIGVLRYACQGT